MYHAEVYRTDTRQAQEFGLLAFEGHFKTSSPTEIESYMTVKAASCDTCSKGFEVSVWFEA